LPFAERTAKETAQQSPLRSTSRPRRRGEDPRRDAEGVRQDRPSSTMPASPASTRPCGITSTNGARCCASTSTAFIRAGGGAGNAGQQMAASSTSLPSPAEGNLNAAHYSASRPA
jgi:hypothetical protein